MSRTINQSVRAKGVRKSKKHRKGVACLGGRPQLRGICSSIQTQKPKKPNSALRKITYVTLSTGQKVKAYITGEGHNLQEHAVVLVQGGKTQDLPGLRVKVVPGALDRAGIANRKQGRSKYGAKKSKK